MKHLVIQHLQNSETQQSPKQVFDFVEKHQDVCFGSVKKVLQELVFQKRAERIEVTKKIVYYKLRKL